MSGAPGLELLLALVREEARARCCPACGAQLADGEVTLSAVAPDRILAVAACRCGAVESVEVRPAAEGGAASVL